ncbi:MAG: TonB-dependent receptor domain-containing protein [Salinibacter sp.]|uniref:TonB-dependent receptor domain-containing protein n=1 Tax=Salinibacter sp. TaxID=2065818 RepID=UPI0035D47455
MPRFLLGLLIGLAAVGIAKTGAHAQAPIELRVTDVPLETALAEVRAQADLDLVYANRLVEGRTATCTYEGADREAALDCVLEGTGVQATQVRRGQYVLVPGSSGQKGRKEPRASLTGYVLDTETGGRLPGANVYLTKLGVGTTTNQDGYFVLPDLPPKTYEVRVSYVGYQSVDTMLTVGGDPARLSLGRSTVESEEIVVEAGSTSTDEDARFPGTMSVALDRISQLPSLGEQDLFRALQWKPGIRKSGVISGGLSIRGGDPDQNLYLLDGAPVYHPWHAFSLISTFQTGTLRSTKLYRGSFPVEHGGRLSAVLDAHMKNGERRTPKAVAALSVLSGRFRIETPLTSSTSFMLSGRRSYLDKIIGRRHTVTGPGGRQDTLRTGYYFFDTSAKLTHQFSEGHRLSLSYYHGRDDLDLRLPFDLSLDFSSWLRPADLLFEVSQNWDNRVLSAQHRYLAGSDIFVKTTAYYSGYRAQEASFVQPTTTASLSSDYRVRLHDTGLKVDVDYHHSVSHELEGGLEVSTLQFESMLDSELQRSSGALTRRYQESRVGAAKVVGYLQDTWTPTPQWTLRTGVRTSYFSGGNHVRAAPQLSAQYIVHPQLILRGSAGVHVQYLQRLRDRYSLAYDLVSSRWIPSSERVQPATGGHLGLGAQARLRPGWTVELNAYARGVRRFLVPTDAFQEKDGIEGPGIEVGALLGQYTEGGKRAFGLELSTRFERGRWDARLGASVGRTFVRAPSRSGFRWRPSDLDVPLSVRGTLSWQGRNWNVSAATELRSGYPTTVPVARYRLGDPVEEDPMTYLYRPQINNGRLPPYFRVDLSVGYKFQLLSANWTATVDVFNALNQDNVLSQTYRPTSTGVNVDRQRGFPILPLLELKMEL